MKKLLFSSLLSGLLLLSACGGPTAQAEDGTLRILATTYPVYLFTTAVTEGVDGVEVTQLVNQPTSCLHDYTLTVKDMKAIESADLIVINGVGLEDFMSDALAASDAPVIDASVGIELLPAMGHEGHDHETEYDPHIWMDPNRAAQMVENIGSRLAELDESRAGSYKANTSAALDLLGAHGPSTAAEGLFTLATGHASPGSVCSHLELITFHDGFQYFADAYGLDVLKAIEEEEGSEASAAEIKEIVALIETYGVPAIFTEVNGSDATAQAIARETGAAVYTLSMLMSGEGTGLQPYMSAMGENLQTLVEALQ